MKKKMAALLAALMLPACALAAETIRIDGTIEAVRTQTIAAPHSGRVGDFAVREGDMLSAGDALFTLSADKIYADFDGAITGVFAQPGDSASSVQDRYGALCYIEDDVRYKAVCTNSGADGDIEDKVVHAGETVYIKSTQNTSRKGEGRVTAISAEGYTVEICAARMRERRAACAPRRPAL